MAEILKPDLCIIGASALGIALARQARSRGLEVVLVDRGISEDGDRPLGALHRAAFAASAARIHAIRQAARLGIEVATPKPNYRTISEQAAARAAAMAPMESAVRLTALGISVKTGAARFVDKRTLGIGDERIRASHFVLATGASPVVPDLPGLDQVAFFTPDSILKNIRKLSHLVVIGGDATALELAQAFVRLGTAVTLVPHGPLLAAFDPEPVAILLRHLREEGVD
ncbi:MAG TPA: FAD-dependent oxidoreductase, partial [Devosia sp.]|nr:FAD-dependent oxidoreductase [Devosia sp.]